MKQPSKLPAHVVQLELVCRMGLLTREQFTRCLFSDNSGTYGWKQLDKLRDNGWVNIQEFGDFKKYVYTPTTQGNNYLTGQYFRPKFGLVRASSVRVDLHNLEAQEPLVMAHELVKHHQQIELISYLSEPILRQNPINGTEPDGVVRLRYQDNGLLLAFEWDRGTESEQKLFDKLEGYIGLGQPENIQKRLELWGSRSLFIVWVLPDVDRLQYVKDLLERLLNRLNKRSYAGAFRLGLSTSYRDFFFKEVWHQPFNQPFTRLLPVEWENR